jgi:hypothetical protein
VYLGVDWGGTKIEAIAGTACYCGMVYNPPLDELFEGGRGRPALLNGRPIAPHPGRDLTEGIVTVGYSPRVGPDQIVPVFDRPGTASWPGRRRSTRRWTRSSARPADAASTRDHAGPGNHAGPGTSGVLS